MAMPNIGVQGKRLSREATRRVFEDSCKGRPGCLLADQFVRNRLETKCLLQLDVVRPKSIDSQGYDLAYARK